MEGVFAADKELVMSEERQQGLYGELLFLGECLDSQGVGAVSHWAGSEDETHDFYFGPHAVEVKTTSAQAPILPVSAVNTSWIMVIFRENYSCVSMRFAEVTAGVKNCRNELQPFAAG